MKRDGFQQGEISQMKKKPQNTFQVLNIKKAPLCRV